MLRVLGATRRFPWFRGLSRDGRETDAGRGTRDLVVLEASWASLGMHLDGGGVDRPPRPPQPLPCRPLNRPLSADRDGGVKRGHAPVRQCSRMSPEGHASRHGDGPLLVGDEAGVVGEVATTSVPPISPPIADSAGIESRSWPPITIQLGPTSTASTPKSSIRLSSP
jgi:hypothetical protein